MRTVCAWCGVIIRTGETGETDEFAGLDSHGMCETCRNEMEALLTEECPRDLDRGQAKLVPPKRQGHP